MPLSQQMPGRIARVMVVLGLLACGSSDDGGGGGPVVAVRIDLTPDAVGLTDCEQTAVQAVAYDAADHPLAGVPITFTSSDAAVATISNSGQVVAHGAGSAVLRGEAGSLTDSVTVTVADSATWSLPSRLSDLRMGELDTIIVQSADCRAQPRPVTGVTYTALGPSIVTVSNSGVLTPVAGGQAFVRVAVGPLLDSVDVAVLTHPAGTLGTSTAVSGSPFGIAVRRNGVILTALLTGGAVGVLPAAGGSFTTFLTGSAPTDVATSPDGLRGMVSNQLDGALGLLALGTPSQTGPVQLNFNPFRVVRARDGSRFFVTGNGTTVLAVSPTTGQTVGTYTMEPNQNGLAETTDGAFLYASSMTSGVVREISLATGTVGRTFAVPGTPQEVALSSNDSELFVAVESQPNIYVWDLASGNLSDSIPVGNGTFGMAMSPDGQRLYAASPAAGKVYILDPAAHAVLDSLPVGGIPRRIAFNAAGTLGVVSNQAGWVDFIH